MTNDDGIDAPGLLALRRALEARPETYEVTVVAPRSDRSGSGMAKTKGNLGVIQYGPHAYAVLGTPADCVVAALGGILAGSPDLVVSGMNSGANLGRVALMSGTVGAAMTAASLGVPAIAVSVGSLEGGSERTRKAFPEAAALTERIVDALVKRSGVLPAGTILSVNYPALPVAEIRGLRVTRQAPRFPGHQLFTLVPSPELRPSRRRWSLTRNGYARPATLGKDDEDVRAFADGWITVTPMDGDWTDASKMQQVSDLLRDVPSNGRRP